MQLLGQANQVNQPIQTPQFGRTDKYNKRLY